MYIPYLSNIPITCTYPTYLIYLLHVHCTYPTYLIYPLHYMYIYTFIILSIPPDITCSLESLKHTLVTWYMLLNVCDEYLLRRSQTCFTRNTSHIKTMTIHCYGYKEATKVCIYNKFQHCRLPDTWPSDE